MSDVTIWAVIVILGAGTFAIRFSFLGIIGSRRMPPLVLRLLRYTPVAVLPGLVAPLVLWPQAAGGDPDPARLAAGAVVLAVGIWTRNVIPAVLSGFVVLYAGLWLTGAF